MFSHGFCFSSYLQVHDVSACLSFPFGCTVSCKPNKHFFSPRLLLFIVLITVIRYKLVGIKVIAYYCGKWNPVGLVKNVKVFGTLTWKSCSVYVHVPLCEYGVWVWLHKGVGIGVIGNCKPLKVGVRKWTWSSSGVIHALNDNFFSTPQEYLKMSGWLGPFLLN